MAPRKGRTPRIGQPDAGSPSPTDDWLAFVAELLARELVDDTAKHGDDDADGDAEEPD